MTPEQSKPTNAEDPEVALTRRRIARLLAVGAIRAALAAADGVAKEQATDSPPVASKAS